MSPARAPGRLRGESFALCTLIGPASRSPGVYGTDLGFTARDPNDTSRLAILFGDTWARPGGACQYPVPDSDDLEASLPAARPPMLRAGNPTGAEGEACTTLRYPHRNSDPTSWPPIRLIDVDRSTKKETVLDTGALRTPLGVFGDGKTLFAIYGRDETAPCKTSNECPERMQCSTDPAYSGTRFGVCAHTSAEGDDAAPNYCRNVTDCGPGLLCTHADRGVCVSTSPFEIRTARGSVSPSWYRNDPRLGIARITYFTERISPERPADYAIVQRLVTNRFVNVTARTVARFDEAHPESNDYRPGGGELLAWGRAQFVAMEGAQNLPFFFHASLENIRGPDGHVHFHPRYFAGYDAGGAAKWSDAEEDAEPIYGADARVASDGKVESTEPDFDVDNQMTFSFVEPLGRWILLYGGDVPAFMVRDAHTGETPDPVHLQRSPGAIHFRTAPHPWGRLRADPLTNEGFSSAMPLLSRADAARFMVCGRGDEGDMPGCLKSNDAAPRDPRKVPVSIETALRCVFGDLTMNAQRGVSGNPIGRLYAPNVIEEWTEDVTKDTPGLAPGDRAVDLYWNVSTWNPYQVVLVKTRLEGPAAEPLQESVRAPE